MLFIGNIGILSQLFFFQQFKEHYNYIILSAILILLNVLYLFKIVKKPRPDQKILDAWHDDPANWRAGIFYYNPKDPRIFPPKRIEGLGWTINFANPISILAMLLLILLIIHIAIWIVLNHPNP